MLFDSHAHLNDARFDEDREALIKKLQEEHVDLVLNPGADIETSISSVELANKYDFIYAAVGVHPHDVKDLDDTAIDTLRKLATENEKVVAIGEIGLDYYYDNSPREVQKEWFKKQIELANELKLPIIIHDRDAHQDTFEIIKNTKSPEIGCVLHCYSGNVELAKEYVKMGCYISIPGTVTFKNNKKTREVAKELAGLKKFLEEFTLIKEREPIEVNLFEDYLIFAQILGIAKKVATQFKKLYPEIIENYNYDFDDIFLIYTISNSGISSANAGSYSSGGGGFSSGGGRRWLFRWSVDGMGSR